MSENITYQPQQGAIPVSVPHDSEKGQKIRKELIAMGASNELQLGVPFHLKEAILLADFPNLFRLLDKIENKLYSWRTRLLETIWRVGGYDKKEMGFDACVFVRKPHQTIYFAEGQEKPVKLEQKTVEESHCFKV